MEVIMKFILLTLLTIGFPCLTFGFGPSYRDEFYIENRTTDDIVIVVKEVGLTGPLLYYNIDNERIVSFRLIRVNDPKAYFRTIKPEEKILIGYSEYNYKEFNVLSPTQKFSAFFDLILIFNSNGDLLHRIDNIDNAIIDDYTTVGPGTYVLVIK